MVKDIMIGINLDIPDEKSIPLDEMDKIDIAEEILAVLEKHLPHIAISKGRAFKINWA